MNFSSDELAKHGFAGFVEWNALVWDEVPPSPGVYVVLHDGAKAPTILDRNPAGRFKERDPTVSIETLEAAWVEGCSLLYIGKAMWLRTRLRQYRAHGDGQPIGHWGGRYIWQLNRSSELRVAWKVTDENPRRLEREMLTSFHERYGQLPFANLRH